MSNCATLTAAAICLALTKKAPCPKHDSVPDSRPWQRRGDGATSGNQCNQPSQTQYVPLKKSAQVKGSPFDSVRR